MIQMANIARGAIKVAGSKTPRELMKAALNSEKRQLPISMQTRGYHDLLKAFMNFQKSKNASKAKVINKSLDKSCPKDADEFLSRLVAPSKESSSKSKLAYQSVLMSLLAKKYPTATFRIRPENTMPRIESAPPEVVFKRGSKFINTGTTDLIEHIKGGKNSQLMGTSFYPQNSCIEGDYLYHLTPVEGTGIDIATILEDYNMSHPSWEKIPWVENEIAIGRFQPSQQYKSCQKILKRSEDNHIMRLGPTIENKNWEERLSRPLETDLSKLWSDAQKYSIIS